MKKFLIGCFISILSISYAVAGNVTTTPKSTATLSSFCSLSVSDIVFGLISPSVGAANQYQAKTISVLCSKGVAYSLLLSFGNNNADHLAAADSRHLIGLTPGNKDILQYNVCTNGGGASCNQIFGGVGAGSSIPGSGTGITQTINYTATVQQSVFITPDNYTDTLVMTLNF